MKLVCRYTSENGSNVRSTKACRVIVLLMKSISYRVIISEDGKREIPDLLIANTHS